MTKADLERLESAGMIYGLKEARMGLGNSIYKGYIYYDVESATETFAVHESDRTILKLQNSSKNIKIRRLENDRIE